MPPKAKRAPAKTTTQTTKAAAGIQAAAPAQANGNLEESIRRRAYELAQARGFEPGAELEDWLRAEAEVRGNSPAA